MLENLFSYTFYEYINSVNKWKECSYKSYTYGMGCLS